jgi:hypothetical protein
VALREWFQAARGIAGLTSEVRRLANAAERIADKLEGRPPSGAEDPDAPELIHTDDAELARLYRIEQRLTGRGSEYPPEDDESLGP